MKMKGDMKFASALTVQSGSSARDVSAAVDDLIEQLQVQDMAQDIDFLQIFISAKFARAASFITNELRQTLNARVMIGCTAEGVIGHDGADGHDAEVEEEPAISLLAAQLPGVELRPFALNGATRGEWDALLGDSLTFRRAIGITGEVKFATILADPFSTPMDDILTAFDMFYPNVPIVGGMASGSNTPGGNVLIYNDLSLHMGLVGVAFVGNITVDTVVSQGCRPVGKLFNVTAAKQNLILELNGRSAFEELQVAINALSDSERTLFRKSGVFLGRAINPDAEILGRGDFLIRGVMGVDPKVGAIAVGDFFHPGDKVQLHVRDAAAAEEDLAMMLAPQTFYSPAQGALLFSCNGRGTRLFDHAHADIGLVQEAVNGVPLAGFFCAGELGPVGGRNFMHGHTASIVFFRAMTESA